MKQQQLSFHRQKLYRIRLIMHFILIFSITLILSSCNSSTTEKEKKGTDTTTAPGVAAAPGGPAPAAIGTFYKYKILKSQIDFAYTKLVLVPVLDNLADPSAMSLYAFPERAAGAPVVGTPTRARNLTDPAAPFGTMGIMMSNNEIILSDFTWANIDYIILEPTRLVDNLSFNVVAYQDQVGGPVIIPPTLPAGGQSKPSPPAPPSFLPKAEKEKDN